jgi:hypothetical protein
MAKATTLQAMTRWMQHVLENDIRLDAALRDHLEATFGSPDPSDVLADPTSSEAASFLELLFFPDDAIHLDFERRWGEERFSEGDEARLVQSLERAAVTAAIEPPSGGVPLEIEVPDYALAAFVRRLNLTWRPPVALLEMVPGTVAAEDVWPVRARLRRIRVAWHPGQIALIERFLARFPRAERDHEACFDLLAAMLAELGPTEAPFDFLVARKYRFFQNLCKIERFERLLQRSNMETLMLQGNRAAHGSKAQWREQMRLVDRLCRQLYGQTPFFRQPSEASLDDTGRSADQIMGDLVRMFT